VEVTKAMEVAKAVKSVNTTTEALEVAEAMAFFVVAFC
jgi:hypothetical protein